MMVPCLVFAAGCEIVGVSVVVGLRWPYVGGRVVFYDVHFFRKPTGRMSDKWHETLHASFMLVHNVKMLRLCQGTDRRLRLQFPNHSNARGGR